MSFLAAPRSVEGPADAVTRLRQAVAEFRTKFDLVLLDTPPMLTTNDASDLLGVADAVVLVLRAGQTRTGPAQRVSIVLSRFRAEVLGVVFNGCEDAEMESYYGYGDSYAYGYLDASPSPADRPDARPRPLRRLRPVAPLLDPARSGAPPMAGSRRIDDGRIHRLPRSPEPPPTPGPPVARRVVARSCHVGRPEPLVPRAQSPG